MSEFQIIKSSAGSGKTHTLVDTYLCLLFNDYLHINSRKFASIMGVTFTNKAAEEMKERIIEALDEIIKKGWNTDYLKKCELSLSEIQLTSIATELRKNILHDYTHFAIGTIDSFVQRVVRSFAFEFHLPANFELQLDTDYVKTVLYELLLEKILDDKDLEYWLTMLVLDKVKEDKFWDIRGDIDKISNFLFQEKFWQILDRVGEEKFKRETFIRLKNKLDEVISEYEDKVQKIKIEVEDFFRPIEGILQENKRGELIYLLRWFSNFDQYDFEDRLSKKFMQKFLNEPNKLNNKDAVLNDFYHQNINKLQELFERIESLIKKDFKRYNTARAIKENIYTLGLFIDMANLLQEYRNRNNEFFILDLTVFLRKLIGESDAPFIYEKIGQRFENIFIDEFQDTSRFQWDNFKPLIANSMALGQTSLVVGDVKQAIYRWRNGDWRILLQEAQEDFRNFAQIKILDTNYRSFNNVVNFNNLVFSKITEILQSDKSLNGDLLVNIKQAYSDVQQKVSPQNKDKFGRVQVHFFKVKGRSNDPKYQAATAKLLEAIKDLRSQGYKYSDIAILVRNNNEAAIFANALVYAQQMNPELEKFSVISNEALFIKYSPAVRTIISALRYLDYIHTNPQDEQGALYFLYHLLFNYFYAHNKDINLADILQIKEKDKLLDYLPDSFYTQLSKLQSLALFDKIQMIIKTLELNSIKDQFSYLRAFEDFVLDFAYKHGSDIKIFLDLWEEQSQGLAVEVSGELDAITIMTIHKSKGLAFPVVIMPKVDWSIKPLKDTIVWAHSSSFDDLPVFPIRYKGEFLNSEFQEDLDLERIYTLMDAINLLYVGFTRPKQQLIIFSFVNNKPNQDSLSNIGQVLYFTLKKLQEHLTYKEEVLVIEEETEFETISFYNQTNFEDKKIISGKNDKKVKNKELTYYNVNEWQEKLKIIFHYKEFFKEIIEELSESIDYGELMHNILSEVKVFEDIPLVVQKFHRNGLLLNLKPQEVINVLQGMIEKAGVRNWFSDQWEVMTEEAVIKPRSGAEIRPDRVIYNAEKLIIIDYKFAQPDNEHIKQVRHYVNTFRKIPLFKNKDIEGYLLYQDGTLKRV